MNSKMKVKGRLTWQHKRKGIIIARGKVDNEVKNEGIDEALDILFTSANLLTWYMGLIDNSGFVSTAVGDTYTNLKAMTLNWTELQAKTYTDPANDLREPINFAPASGGLISSEADPSQFDIVKDGETIKGVMVTNQSSFASSSGWLWSSVVVPIRSVQIGDAFLAGYEVSLARV